jgi:DNA helicase-2/ATP-dependent DNA helicase PcrA
MDPAAILEDLNDEQRQAAMATSGPVVILAGAGTGKTRVISHRVAYAVATGAVDPRRVLVVTFTDKAATEMKHRLRRLDLPSVTASTFHSAAKRQLEFYWPRLHGRPLPNVLDSKLSIVAPLARQLPGGYKFTPAKDLADEIEWAKARRIGPGGYSAEAAQANREPPVPADVFASVYRRYEQAKQRRGVIDFEDMLGLAVDLYETDAEAADLVRQRYAWFSVDEYQDTNRLQEDLLRLWLGDRRDLCVVGDPNQTIYSFTGATADYLTGFADRYAGCRIIDLTQNYRSTPQILALANRLTASRLQAMLGDGASPSLTAHTDAAAEESAILMAIRGHVAAGVPLTEIAILVRTNAQLVPFESLLTRAGIPFTVRGQRFFARAEVRAARQALTSGRLSGGLEQVLVARWRTVMGFDASQPAGPGAEARDRHASLLTLLGIARELLAGSASATLDDYLAELDRRDADEAAAAGSGVVLSTYHRAKGLEWDVVFLPMLEEGTLPIRQSLKDDEAIAEERRLLYVGITRARRDLAISWVAQRPNPKGGVTRARPSRFVGELRPGKLLRSPVAGARSWSEEPEVGGPLYEALRAWRLERARADGVPAYVVADNKTLSAVAARMPASEAELLAVPGMGPHRVATYGDEMLAVIGSTR